MPVACAINSDFDDNIASDVAKWLSGAILEALSISCSRYRLLFHWQAFAVSTIDTWMRIIFLFSRSLFLCRRSFKIGPNICRLLRGRRNTFYEIFLGPLWFSSQCLPTSSSMHRRCWYIARPLALPIVSPMIGPAYSTISWRLFIICNMSIGPYLTRKWK